MWSTCICPVLANVQHLVLLLFYTGCGLTFRCADCHLIVDFCWMKRPIQPVHVNTLKCPAIRFAPCTKFTDVLPCMNVAILKGSKQELICACASLISMWNYPPRIVGIGFIATYPPWSLSRSPGAADVLLQTCEHSRSVPCCHHRGSCQVFVHTPGDLGVFIHML